MLKANLRPDNKRVMGEESAPHTYSPRLFGVLGPESLLSRYGHSVEDEKNRRLLFQTTRDAVTVRPSGLAVAGPAAGARSRRRRDCSQEQDRKECHEQGAERERCQEDEAQREHRRREEPDWKYIAANE